MSKKGYRIAKEVKDEIITKIKHEGLSVTAAGEQYGVSIKTIYGWLGTKAQGTVSVLEHNKLKKDKVNCRRQEKVPWGKTNSSNR